MAEGGGHIQLSNEDKKELTSNNVIILLREKRFRFKNNWKTVATKLNFPIEEKSILNQGARQDIDYIYPLEECVDYWIRNDPNPSWEKLIPIIADVDKASARHMRDSLGLSNVIIIQDVLVSLTDSRLMQLGRVPVDLLTKLEAEGILTRNDCQKLSEPDTWKEVIEYVRDIIKDNREKKVKFGKVMLHYKETTSIGRKIIEGEEESLPSIAVSPTYEKTFDKVLSSFASLMAKIRPKLLLCLPPFRTFKRYVKNLPGLGTKVQDCEDEEDLLDIIEDASSFLNLTKFEEIAKVYNCQEVSADIKEYNDTIDQSCIDIREGLVVRSSLCDSPYISQPLLCESIEFALHWNPEQDTFGKIRCILWKAFEEIAKEIFVVLADDGSVVVLCYIPHTLVPIAVYKAKKNLESLQKLGMIRMSIGYTTILEEKGKEILEEKEEPLFVEESDTASVITKEKEDVLKESLEATEQTLKEKEEENKLLREERDRYKEEKDEWQLRALSSGDMFKNQILEKLSEREKEVETLKTNNKLLYERNQTLETERKKEHQQLSETIKTKSNQLESVIMDSEVKQKELTKQNTSLQEQLDSLNKEQTLQIETHKEEIDKLKKEVHEKDDAHVKEINKLKLLNEKAQSQINEKDNEIDELKKEFQEVQSQVKEKDSLIAKRTAAQSEEIDKLKEDLEKVQSQNKSQTEKLNELQQQDPDETQSQVSEIERLKTRLTIQKKMKDEKVHESEKLRREKEDLENKLHQQLPTLHDDYKDYQHPPVQVIMTSFDAHKRSNDHWYSPSFLSHPRGYRMCLKVRANGEEEGQGTHLSVSVHLMVGENDDQLYWPFRGTVNIEVVNRRRPGGNFTGQIVFSDTSNPEASQRVFNGIPVRTGMASFMGQGGIKFMEQNKLNYDSQNNTEYLRDDSIKLNIVSVIVDPAARPIEQPLTPPTSSEAVLEFKIDNFESRKKSNAECISDPFYSGPNKSGYKFVLMVYPNGRGDYKGKSISVFIHLMKGENDQGLRWPFRGEFVTQIINSIKEQNHVEKLIEFSEDTDPSGKYGARVAGITTYFSSGRSFQGYGFPNFVTHEYLEANEDRDTKYLNDDGSLMLRIMKITVHSQ